MRGLTLAEVQPLGRALFDAGFRMVEVPLNRPEALDCIAALKEMAPADALVGGGTMLTPADVDNVHAAGGRLMVAPNCDTDVIRRACEHGMVAAPGVATPSEAFNALRWGAHALKIFPADMVGSAGLKAFKSVLPPGTPLWPVGGVTPEGIAGWVNAGATGFGIGSQLFQPGVSRQVLSTRAQAFMAAWARTKPAAE
ncbi:MAG: 2-dehydro-3-deoxy-6-phosphogalactonate aldolase [Rhizobacter sp.]|nr:2-dehydro-3-deoxy-6-phosphogalactonate aldolase [Rhizobacter sp.]